MKVLTKLSHPAALKFYKVKSRSSKNPPLNMFNAVDSAHKILFVMPPDIETHDSAQVLNGIQEYFHHHVIVIVKCVHSALPQSLPGMMKVIEIDEEKDVNFIGLPSKALTNKIALENASVAVDLSRDFVFLNTALVFASKASIRAGFFHPEREGIYNFVLRALSTAPLQQSLESLFAYLTFSKDSKNHPPGSSRTTNSVLNY